MLFLPCILTCPLKRKKASLMYCWTPLMQKKNKMPGMPVTRLIFLFAALIMVCPGMAQTMTLDEAIALALKNNYDIRLAKADSLSKAVDNSYSFSVFLPNINATAS